jgi:hypothetical protein
MESIAQAICINVTMPPAPNVANAAAPCAGDFRYESPAANFGVVY